MKKQSGISFYIDLTRNEKHAIELEKDGKVNIKDSLLQNIQDRIEKSINKSLRIFFYLRTNGLIIFIPTRKLENFKGLDEMIMKI